jgi:hypothetical protein
MNLEKTKNKIRGRRDPLKYLLGRRPAPNEMALPPHDSKRTKLTVDESLDRRMDQRHACRKRMHRESLPSKPTAGQVAVVQAQY